MILSSSRFSDFVMMFYLYCSVAASVDTVHVVYTTTSQRARTMQNKHIVDSVDRFWTMGFGRVDPRAAPTLTRCAADVGMCG